MEFMPLYLALFIGSLLFQCRKSLIKPRPDTWHYRLVSHYFSLAQKREQPQPVIYWGKVCLSIPIHAFLCLLLLFLWIGGFVLEGYIPRRPKNFTNQLFPKGNESIFFTRKSFVVHKATLVVAHVFMTVFLIQNATRDTSGLFYSLMVLVVFVLFDLAYISNLRHGIRRMLT